MARERWLDRVGVTVGSIGVSFEWWRDAAVRLDAAGYRGIWIWDHLVGRGPGRRPALEAWTTLAAVAPLTSRATLGTLVTNVMNRHPAVLARVVATLQEMSGGRVVVGLGVGGDAGEAALHGIPLPPIAERVARVEEQAAVIRRLVPAPVPPIVIAGQSAAGARLAARAGDAWTTRPEDLERLLPVYRAARAEGGADGGRVVVGFEGPRAGVDYVAGTAWAVDPTGELARWLARGADEVVLTARTDADVATLERLAGVV